MATIQAPLSLLSPIMIGEPTPVRSSSVGKKPKTAVSPGRRMLARQGSHVRPSPPRAHVVRVTVLGLAGITVDRRKCRDSPNQYNKSKEAPAAPSKMRAVVGFSRNSALRGTTALSKPLTRSPNDDVVLSTTTNNHRDDGSSAKKQQRDDTSHVSDWNRPQRHVAVWASPDNTSLGSVVTFEANLHDRSNPETKGAASYAPKSFELTIALAEDDEEEADNMVALPFGVTSLAIAGNECLNGRSAKLDLPVLSLAQARPLTSNHKNGLGGYPMIAIARGSGVDQNNKSNNSQSPSPFNKKRTGLKRLFQRDPKPKRVPSIDARNAFASAYTMDASGDAIIRVAVEVYEKGSPLESHFLSKRTKDGHSASTGSVHNPPRPTLRPRLTTTTTNNNNNTRNNNNDRNSPYDEKQAHRGAAVAANIPSDESASLEEEDDTTTEYSDSYYTGDTRGTAETDDDDDDASTVDSFVSTHDGVAFFAWNAASPATESDTDDDDGYTLSFEKKERNLGPEEEVDEEPSFSIDLFGRRFRLPVCATLPLEVDGEEDSITTGYTGGDAAATNIGERRTTNSRRRFIDKMQDDMTHVTADFFGKSYEIPMCATLAGKNDDMETITTNHSEDETAAPKIGQFADRLCRPMEAPTSDLDLSIKHTFSTLSDISKRATTVRNYLSIDDDKKKKKAEEESKPELMERRQESYSAEEKVQGTPEKDTVRQSLSDSSPKAIEDFPRITLEHKQGAFATEEQLEDAATGRPLAQSFSKVFHCRTSQSPVLEIETKYEPNTEDIPPLIIPSIDSASVGDLTAPSLDVRQGSEAQMLGEFRRKFHEQEARRRGRSLPLPIAFGGSGVCSDVGKVDSPPRKPFRDRAAKENYFEEYDDYSNMSPVARTGQERDRVSSALHANKE